MAPCRRRPCCSSVKMRIFFRSSRAFGISGMSSFLIHFHPFEAARLGAEAASVRLHRVRIRAERDVHPDAGPRATAGMAAARSAVDPALRDAAGEECRLRVGRGASAPRGADAGDRGSHVRIVRIDGGCRRRSRRNRVAHPHWSHWMRVTAQLVVGVALPQSRNPPAGPATSSATTRNPIASAPNATA